jgi:hypothetical protein
MGYEKLIRYGFWALFIASCILFVWWVSSSIHESIYNDGRLAERAEWEAKVGARGRNRTGMGVAGPEGF